jgi:outer membrane protein TolC
MKLTLEQAIGLGLQNSSSLRTKMLTVASAGTDVQAAKSVRYTDVSMSVSYSHLFEQPESFGVYISAQDPVMVEINAQQSVYTFGKIKNGIALAEVGLQSARFDLDEEKRSLIMAIKRGFYGYILAREVLVVQEETFLNKQEALEIALMRFESGLGTELEVLSAESDVENFFPDVLSARNEVDFAILAVIDLLDLDVGEGEFDIVLLGELVPDYHTFKKSELIELALKNNYDVQQYNTGINAARIQQNLAAREKYPNIATYANYLVQSGFNSTTGKNKYTGKNSWSDLLTVGVAVQMPLSALFPWSSQHVNKKKSDFDLESLQTGLRSVEGGIKLAIQNLLLRLEEERAKILSGEKSVAVTKRFLEMSETSFANGLISSTDLKDAHLNLNTAQLGHLSAIFSYNLALYDLYDVIGVDHL